jgi:hypothetical protein
MHRGTMLQAGRSPIRVPDEMHYGPGVDSAYRWAFDKQLNGSAMKAYGGVDV